jgi:predicted nucleotidyltransferase
MNIGLTDSQKIEIRKVLCEYKSIESAILFGSRAMGTNSPASDVDIALTGDISLRDQIRISAQLNESKALLKYDIVRYSIITNKKLIEHIRKYGKKIYEKENGAGTKDGFSSFGFRLQ